MTVSIKIPEGYEIDHKTSTLEKIVFKRIKKENKLITSFDEIESISGFYVSPYELRPQHYNSTDLFLMQEDQVYPTSTQAFGGRLLPRLLQVRDSLRDGWSPLSHTGEKWSVMPKSFDKKEGYCELKAIRSIDSQSGLIFSFQSQELAKHFINYFGDSVLLFYNNLW